MGAQKWKSKAVMRPSFRKARYDSQADRVATIHMEHAAIIAPKSTMRIVHRDDGQDNAYDQVEVTREQPVLEHTAIGDVDALTLVRDDDNCSTQCDVATEIHIASDCQVVELDDGRDLLEALLELRDLLEVVAELDDRRSLEHALGVDDELTMLEGVDVTLDEEEV